MSNFSALQIATLTATILDAFLLIVVVHFDFTSRRWWSLVVSRLILIGASITLTCAVLLDEASQAYNVYDKAVKILLPVSYGLVSELVEIVLMLFQQRRKGLVLAHVVFVLVFSALVIPLVILPLCGLSLYHIIDDYINDPTRSEQDTNAHEELFTGSVVMAVVAISMITTLILGLINLCTWAFVSEDDLKMVPYGAKAYRAYCCCCPCCYCSCCCSCCSCGTEDGHECIDNIQEEKSHLCKETNLSVKQFRFVTFWSGLLMMAAIVAIIGVEFSCEFARMYPNNGMTPEETYQSCMQGLMEINFPSMTVELLAALLFMIQVRFDSLDVIRDYKQMMLEEKGEEEV